MRGKLLHFLAIGPAFMNNPG